jgi:hypothetical protein
MASSVYVLVGWARFTVIDMPISVDAAVGVNPTSEEADGPHTLSA